MSETKMGEMIEEIRNYKPSLLARFGQKIRRGLAVVTWKLWGRRRALAKMRRLAFGRPYVRKPRISTEEELEKHRMHLDSLYIVDPLPRPDSEDMN